MTEDIRACFLLLEVEPGAPLEEVRRAYRELIKVWHPDRFPNDTKFQHRATEKTKAINEAYYKLKAYLESNFEYSEARATEEQAERARTEANVRAERRAREDQLRRAAEEAQRQQDQARILREMAVEQERLARKRKLAMRAANQGIASMWLGLVGFFCLSPFFICSVLSILFGIQSLSAYVGSEDRRGQWKPIFGIISGAFAILLGLCLWVGYGSSLTRGISPFPLADSRWSFGIQQHDKDLNPFPWGAMNYYPATVIEWGPKKTVIKVTWIDDKAQTTVCTMTWNRDIDPNYGTFSYNGGPPIGQWCLFNSDSRFFSYTGYWIQHGKKLVITLGPAR